MAAIEKAKLKVVVIGCGAASVIKKFQEQVEFQGELYSDPKREVYKALGLKDSLKARPTTEKPSKYSNSGAMGGIWYGIKMSLSQGPTKTGSYSQQGAEFVLGPGDICHFSYLNDHPTDHADLEDVLLVAGVELKK